MIRRTHSIKYKLTRLIAFAICSAMLLIGGLEVWQESVRYLTGKRETLTAAASAFAAASADALAKQDASRAYLALRGIGAVPGIEFAALDDVTGRRLASIGSGVRLAGDLELSDETKSSPFALLTTRTVSVDVPVKQGGQRIGRLMLVAQASDVWPRIRGLLESTAMGALLALALALIISLRLQRSITRPLLVLTDTMTRIQADHDYTAYVRVESDDEAGVLAQSFNKMIGEVLERDRRLIAHRDRLEQEVSDRTQDLRLAKEDAEAANAAKSTFLATMSHEIRTPMTGMLVMAELLASGDLPARSRRYAEVVCRSGTALLAIINDILDFSKIEAGKLEVERVRVEIREVVGTVINLFYARAAEKGLDLAATFDANVPVAIEGDPVRLQQVISNLVNNALKFTKAGHVIVNVRFDEGVLTCSVVDTGIGITKQKLDRIFEAFTQADNSTTREFGGTGLGLSISSRLVEAMGGQIKVESTIGEGSAFICIIPAAALETASVPVESTEARIRAFVAISKPATAQAVRLALDHAAIDVASEAENIDILLCDSANAAARAHGTVVAVICLVEPGVVEPDGCYSLKMPFSAKDLQGVLHQIASGEDAPSTKSSAVTAISFAGARILVVDDTAVNREVMIEVLSRFNVVPDLATNGLEALEAAAQAPYDLIFMDGSMPELDGFEASRRLRLTDGANKDTPVVALTAHVVGTAADAWRDAGMNGVLHKPFTLAELQRTLEAFLTASGQRIDHEPALPQVPASLDDEEPILDEKILEDIIGISRTANRDFARRVFSLFLDQAPICIANLRAAEAAEAAEGVASAAHAIKSMSYNIGAKQAGAAAAHVERGARDGTIADDDIIALETSLDKTYEKLRTLLTDATTALVA